MLDLAWASGFLEGEASFRFNSRTASGSGSPTITAAQKNPESLWRLHRLFGGNAPTTIYLARPGGVKCQYYQWRIYGTLAVSVMFTLFSWLSGYRREQIRSTIAKWKPLPGPNGPRRRRGA